MSDDLFPSHQQASRLLDDLTPWLDVGDNDARFEWLFARPAYLSGHVQHRLAAAVEGRTDADRLRAALGFLARVRGALGSGDMHYPLGAGPIEAIARRVRQGEVSATQGLVLAREPAMAHGLPSTYVVAISRAGAGGDAAAPPRAPRLGCVLLHGNLAVDAGRESRQ